MIAGGCVERRKRERERSKTGAVATAAYSSGGSANDDSSVPGIWERRPKVRRQRWANRSEKKMDETGHFWKFSGCSVSFRKISDPTVISVSL
ncbi:hypothetical protein LINPERHAP1_LOCUS8194 [Linum perenne]